MTRFERQGGGGDADFQQGFFPLAGKAGAEEQIVVGGDGQPAIGLYLGVQLPRAPSGIAEGENNFRGRCPRRWRGGYRPCR